MGSTAVKRSTVYVDPPFCVFYLGAGTHYPIVPSLRLNIFSLERKWILVQHQSSPASVPFLAEVPLEPPSLCPHLCL